MLMPESEPTNHLSRAEVDAALVCLTQNVSELSKARKLARTIAYGLPAMGADDLLQTSFTLLMSGVRKWRSDLSTLAALRGVMRSVAHNVRKKSTYVLAGDLVVQHDDDSDTDSSSLLEGVTSTTDPARRIEGESELDAVSNAVKGDEELELYVEALAEGLTGKAISQAFGWNELKSDAVRKKFSRRLASLKANRS